MNIRKNKLKNFIPLLRNKIKTYLFLLGNPECVFCGKQIELKNEFDLICTGCKEKIKRKIQNFKRCPICSAFIKKEFCENYHHKNLEKVFSLFPLYPDIYEPYLKAKYRKDIKLIEIFLEIFNNYFPEEIIEQYKREIDFITFVPISLYKKILRKYNPSYLFAKILSRKIQKPLKNVFKEKGFKYFHIERKDYSGTFSDRFILKKNKQIKDSKILIVDDIYTTGKTASYLADLLIINGATKIYLCTFFNHK